MVFYQNEGINAISALDRGMSVSDEMIDEATYYTVQAWFRGVLDREISLHLHNSAYQVIGHLMNETVYSPPSTFSACLDLVELVREIQRPRKLIYSTLAQIIYARIITWEPDDERAEQGLATWNMHFDEWQELDRSIIVERPRISLLAFRLYLGSRPKYTGPALSREITRAFVLARDDETCQYCHAKSVPLTVDHIIPRVQGGSDDLNNLIAACIPCNCSKGGNRPEEWLS